MTCHTFKNYLCQLYQSVAGEVKDTQVDSQLIIRKYDCLSDAYVGKWGHSYEPDFDSGCFDPTNLHSWQGYIEAIHGKVLSCRDCYGHHHHIQISPCSHFEGEFPLPLVGMKIFWTGVPQPCGRTYVHTATVCNSC